MFVRVGQWRKVEFRIPPEASRGQLRIDPSDAPGVIELRGIVLHLAGPTGVPKPVAIHPDDLRFGGTAVRLPHDSALAVLSYGQDPQLLLPEMAGWLGGGSVEMTVRAQTGATVLADHLRSVVGRVLAATASEEARRLLEAVVARPEEAARMIDGYERLRRTIEDRDEEIVRLRQELKRARDGHARRHG